MEARKETFTGTAKTPSTSFAVHKSSAELEMRSKALGIGQPHALQNEASTAQMRGLEIKVGWIYKMGTYRMEVGALICSCEC